MERRFREEASTYIKSTVETDEPPLRILCMDGGGARCAISCQRSMRSIRESRARCTKRSTSSVGRLSGAPVRC